MQDRSCLSRAACLGSVSCVEHESACLHGHNLQLAADHVAGASFVHSQLCSHYPLESWSVQLLFVLGLA